MVGISKIETFRELVGALKLHDAYLWMPTSSRQDLTTD